MLNEYEWEVLVDRIRQKACTPFLGAGAAAGSLPLGRDVAQEWAGRYSYPLGDATNLIQVAQFVAVKFDRVKPKEMFLKQIKGAAPPDLENPLETHRAIAELRLPVYLTTNYDSFLTQALKHLEKIPEREFFRWSPLLKELTRDSPSIFEREPGYQPHPARPLVFHLHGSDQLVDSLVLTEDDYIDFLVNMAQEEFELPPVVARALTGSSLLFVGYSIADWNFRVLLNSLNRYKSPGQRRLNVAVMKKPDWGVDPGQVQDYLTRYYADMQVRIHWADAREFLAELHERMNRT
jgi:hypothetical protein